MTPDPTMLLVGALAALALASSFAAFATRRRGPGGARLMREAVFRSLGPLGAVCMADTAEVVPAGTFWASAGGLAPKTTTKRVRTAAGIRKGRYVELDTTDEEVKLAGADTLRAIGVVIQNLTDHAWDGDADPAAGDVLVILLLGSGEIAVVWTGDDLSLERGQVVGVDANGEAKLVDPAKPLSKAGRVHVGADGSAAAAKMTVVL